MHAWSRVCRISAAILSPFCRFSGHVFDGFLPLFCRDSAAILPRTPVFFLFFLAFFSLFAAPRRRTEPTMPGLKNLAVLNGFLADKSYIEGYAPVAPPCSARCVDAGDAVAQETNAPGHWRARGS